jgi:hypothetical protein
MNNRVLYVLGVLAAAQLSAGNKVYVATFGNDGNPCDTFSQPCRTWLGAISKAGPSGVVLALDSGDFGTIDISQPIIIDGGAHGAFATGDSTIVSVGLGQTALGPVILRNISVVINPPSGNLVSNTGVFASLSGGSLVLDHVSVTVGPAILQTQSAEGISIGAAPGVPVDLKDVAVSGVFRGIDIANVVPNPTAPANAVLQNVSVSASQIGLNVNETAVIVRNSSFRGASTGIGIHATSTSPVSMLDSTQVTNNGTGISVTGGTMRLFNNVISGNTTGITTSNGATVISFRNNAFAGNGTDGSPALSTSLK